MPEEQALTPSQPAAPATPTPPATRRFELPADPVSTPQPAKPEATAAGSAPPAETQNKEDQAPSAESEGDKPKEEALTPEQAAERERKREGARFGRKLDKAYRQRAEAQARADLLEKQLAEARSAQPQAKPADGEPKLADFDYDPEKYAAAKADHARKQAEKELGEKQRTQSQSAERQKLVSAWEEKAEKAADKYDDWETIVGELQPDSPFVATIMEADNGEEVAYHLGKHPKEAERIAKLPPRLQVFEIGKLSAKLSATPEKPKTPSKAPAPITPLTGAAPLASAEPTEQDDMKAWIRKRTKQVLSRR